MKRFVTDYIKELAVIALIAVLLVICLIVRPDLFAGGRFPDIVNSILLWTPLNMTMALGMMMVIVIRDIDLSIGSSVALSSMVAGIFFRDYAMENMQNTSQVIVILIGIVISVVVGVGCGALNGFVIAYLRIPSIIVTLATFNAYRGLTYIISNGKQVTGYELPSSLSDIVSQGLHFGRLLLPWLVLFMFVIVAIFFYMMRNAHFGRELYAIGSNRNAAHLRGINCEKSQFLVFTITGGLAGLTGVMSAARFGYVNPSNTGNGLEFVVISIVIIGGVSISGGSGTVLGVLLGCLLLGTVNTVISTIGIPGTVQKFVYGSIVVLALLLDRSITVMKEKQVVELKARKEGVLV
jgi:rhamnose transport system permease protein